MTSVSHSASVISKSFICMNPRSFRSPLKKSCPLAAGTAVVGVTEVVTGRHGCLLKIGSMFLQGTNCKFGVTGRIQIPLDSTGIFRERKKMGLEKYGTYRCVSIKSVYKW